MSSALTDPLDSQNGSKSSFEGAFIMEIEDDALATQKVQDNLLPMLNGLRTITERDVVYRGNITDASVSPRRSRHCRKLVSIYT